MIIRFWLLDINYDLVGGIPEIRLWGIDDKGKRVVILERNFRPYVYILPINEQFLEKITEEIDKLRNKYKILEIDVAEKKYFGKILKVLKVTLLNPRNVPRFREDLSKIRGIKEVLEADIRFYMRYMIDNDIYPSAWHDVEVEEVSNKNRWDVDHVYIAKKTPIFVSYENPPDLRIFAFDIECYNVLGEPNPLRDPVIIIATLNKNKEIKIFQARDKDDEELIKNFIKDIKEYDPDIIVGYNSNRFDWPYLRERTKHLKIRLDVSRAGGQPTQSVYGHFSIVGRANIDLFDFAEEINEVKVKTLENIADYLGVKKKNERVLIEGAFIYEYWDKLEKRKILVEYSKDDVESTYGLAEKFLPFAIQLSNIVGLPLDQVGSASVGYRVEWHLMRQAYKFNELIPNRIERPYETYKGAIVLKPKPGIHKNVAVLDFSSMYPNIMIQKNISPDTYVPPYEKIDESKVYIAPEVGHRFLKNPPGFYKKILERLLKARKEIRNKMKKLDPSSIEYRILDERQKALKIIANATYG
ncbi:MAG: ribonuclease H-like domain-containing protein, partial [Thermoproteales archaeon]|nr:ribonuclease H-like domain-containing protein [Thermoproteales archaeon]